MFSLEDAVEEKFDSFDETLAFVSEEKRRIVRLPISGLWKNGARFHDDGSFGNESSSVKFNSYGFQAVGSLIGASDRVLLRLTKPELTARVLNDLMSSSLERELKPPVLRSYAMKGRKLRLGSFPTLGTAMTVF